VLLLCERGVVSRGDEDENMAPVILLIDLFWLLAVASSGHVERSIFCVVILVQMSFVLDVSGVHSFERSWSV
jgi:hypothetical protein